MAMSPLVKFQLLSLEFVQMKSSPVLLDEAKLRENGLGEYVSKGYDAPKKVEVENAEKFNFSRTVQSLEMMYTSVSLPRLCVVETQSDEMVAVEPVTCGTCASTPALKLTGINNSSRLLSGAKNGVRKIMAYCAAWYPTTLT